MWTLEQAGRLQAFNYRTTLLDPRRTLAHGHHGQILHGLRQDYLPPWKLVRENARRMIQELLLDKLGVCRFHRAWAETLMPDIVEHLFGLKEAFLRSLRLTASRNTSRNASVFWEPARNMDMVFTFMKNKKEIDDVNDLELDSWIDFFTRDRHAAAYEFWHKMHKGIHEMLSEFPV